MKHISHYLKQVPIKVIEVELSYTEFMLGMCNSPGISGGCKECYGHGLMPVMCCDGSMCGCRGMPVDFVKCDCGSPPPSNSQIKEWSEY